ncbi:putative transporter [Trachipleistophora hominis]|uniref:Putative transporter n=1 Tax=Trachipleistophora hominis TaxID=72359 RepID=L7JSB5_TRAHO|nr:putative transporter [Trachipleistophora hominis]
MRKYFFNSLAIVRIQIIGALFFIGKVYFFIGALNAVLVTVLVGMISAISSVMVIQVREYVCGGRTSADTECMCEAGRVKSGSARQLNTIFGADGQCKADDGNCNESIEDEILKENEIMHKRPYGDEHRKMRKINDAEHTLHNKNKNDAANTNYAMHKKRLCGMKEKKKCVEEARHCEEQLCRECVKTSEVKLEGGCVEGQNNNKTRNKAVIKSVNKTNTTKGVGNTTCAKRVGNCMNALPCNKTAAKLKKHDDNLFMHEQRANKSKIVQEHKFNIDNTNKNACIAATRCSSQQSMRMIVSNPIDTSVPKTCQETDKRINHAMHEINNHERIKGGIKGYASYGSLTDGTEEQTLVCRVGESPTNKIGVDRKLAVNNTSNKISAGSIVNTGRGNSIVGQKKSKDGKHEISSTVRHDKGVDKGNVGVKGVNKKKVENIVHKQKSNYKNDLKSGLVNTRPKGERKLNYRNDLKNGLVNTRPKGEHKLNYRNDLKKETRSMNALNKHKRTKNEQSSGKKKSKSNVRDETTSTTESIVMIPKNKKIKEMVIEEGITYDALIRQVLGNKSCIFFFLCNLVLDLITLVINLKVSYNFLEDVLKFDAKLILGIIFFSTFLTFEKGHFIVGVGEAIMIVIFITASVVEHFYHCTRVYASTSTTRDALSLFYALHNTAFLIWSFYTQPFALNHKKRQIILFNALTCCTLTVLGIIRHLTFLKTSNHFITIPYMNDVLRLLIVVLQLLTFSKLINKMCKKRASRIFIFVAVFLCSLFVDDFFYLKALFFFFGSACMFVLPFVMHVKCYGVGWNSLMGGVGMMGIVYGAVMVFKIKGT